MQFLLVTSISYLDCVIKSELCGFNKLCLPLLQISSFFVGVLLANAITGNPTPDFGDFPNQMQQDSYATIPKTDDNVSETELQLELLPPALLASSGPQLFYMNADGIAIPVEQQKLVRRRRVPFPVASDDESLLTDETVIIGPPSGNNPFGTPAINLGYRPARAYYARRYHKYPWNYH